VPEVPLREMIPGGLGRSGLPVPRAEASDLLLPGLSGKGGCNRAGVYGKEHRFSFF